MRVGNFLSLPCVEWGVDCATSPNSTMRREPRFLAGRWRGLCRFGYASTDGKALVIFSPPQAGAVIAPALFWSHCAPARSSNIANVTVDPDYAWAVGVVVGQMAGGFGVWLSWGPVWDLSLTLVAAVAVGAIFGAVCFGYAACKAAERWGSGDMSR